MCGKIGYKTTKQASTAMLTIKKHSKRSVIPKRVYFCKDCNQYHLTSKLEKHLE